MNTTWNCFSFGAGLAQGPQTLTGRTDTFWDGLGCPSGAFCPFNGLRSTPNHFQTLPGHTDKKAYPYPPPTHTPMAAAGCAIQPWADSSVINSRQWHHYCWQKIQHLSPVTDFYKKLSLDCSAQQVAVDMFMLNAQYADIATIGQSYRNELCLLLFK